MRRRPIPSSLKWLVTQRARLDGERVKQDAEFESRLAGLDRAIREAKENVGLFQAEREQFIRVHMNLREIRERDVAALDTALGLYDIKVEPESIQTIRSHSRGSLFSHGQMTRTIYEYLRMARGERCGVTEIAVFVQSRLRSQINSTDFEDLRFRVRHRLKGMARAGKIEQIKSPVANVESWYRLKAADRALLKNSADARSETTFHGDD
jgi:hypothetical protein